MNCGFCIVYHYGDMNLDFHIKWSVSVLISGELSHVGLSILMLISMKSGRLLMHQWECIGQRHLDFNTLCSLCKACMLDPRKVGF